MASALKRFQRLQRISESVDGGENSQYSLPRFMETFYGKVRYSGRKNRATGQGFGFTVPVAFRERLFKREWRSVVIYLDGKEHETTLHETFWMTCNHLQSREISEWLAQNGLTREWPRRQPPIVSVKQRGGNQFEVYTSK